MGHPDHIEQMRSQYAEQRRRSRADRWWDRANNAAGAAVVLGVLALAEWLSGSWGLV